MRAVCPSDAGPDIFVDFPAGATSADLWRYGCRFAGENDQPTAQDFVATGVVNLDTPALGDAPPAPRFAEPDPPSFFLDAVATTPPVVKAPEFTPRAAAANPPSWIADLGNVIATTATAVVDVVRGVPRLASPPVVLDLGPRFTDAGITQTQPDYVPTTFTAPDLVPTPALPRMAEPNPQSFFADLGNVLATVTAAVVDVVRPVPRIAQPDPVSFIAAPAPEPSPAPTVNRPRPASARTVCLRLPGGGYVSVPPEYRNGYDGEEVDYSLCLIQPDGIPATDILGPGGGSNPVEVPPADPTPTPSPVLENFIPTGIVTLIDNVVSLLRPQAPATYQPVTFTPTGIVTPPAGDVSAEAPSTSSGKPCSCHERSGEKRNWMLLLAGAALVYVLTRKSK